MVLRRELETLLVIILASLAALFFVQNLRKNPQIEAPVSVPEIKILPTSVPTPVIEKTSQTSSDGTMKLSMDGKQINDTSKEYSFYVSETPENKGEQLIYTATVDNNSSFSIPYNTFSVDNTFFFLELSSKNGPKYLVFRANGELFENGERYLDVNSFYNEKNYDNTLYKVTGWTSNTVLIIQTKTKEGKWGYSTWFDVTGKYFIPLSISF